MIYALIFVLLLVSELIYFAVAVRSGIIDRPNHRSSHIEPTVKGGGIIFALGAWMAAAFFGLDYPLFYIGLTLLAAISLRDDIHALSGPIRLTAQLVAMAVLMCGVVFVATVPWWAFPIVIIAGIWAINAYNFMDGINGMTAAYSLTVLGTLCYIETRTDFVAQPFIIVMMIAVAVFSLFNFRARARCFAGDVGSISMGFIMVLLLGRLIAVTGDFSYLVLVAVYGVDSALTLCHRLLLRQNILHAHRMHLYQIMANELHMPHRAVALIYAGIQAIVSAGLLLLPAGRYLYAFSVFIILCGAYVLFMRKYFDLHKRTLCYNASK